MYTECVLLNTSTQSSQLNFLCIYVTYYFSQWALKFNTHTIQNFGLSLPERRKIDGLCSYSISGSTHTVFAVPPSNHNVSHNNPLNRVELQWYLYQFWYIFSQNYYVHFRYIKVFLLVVGKMQSVHNTSN